MNILSNRHTTLLLIPIGFVKSHFYLFLFIFPTGDSLSYHSGQKFSTFDRDQDLYVQNCAALSSGAWWFKSCHFSNLNGFYLGGPHLSYANGINWYQWKGFYYSLKRSEMKIRRV